MFLPVLSGLIVSVDALFIGLSLGLQKKCKFLYLVIINIFLFLLCALGFLIAGQVYELIKFNVDIVVGITFISLGLWYILHYFISEKIKHLKEKTNEEKTSLKTIVLVGLVMSMEAMMITMGLTFIFIEISTFLIPVTVALAHFIYSALMFSFARTKHVKKIPPVLSHVISGLALIIYGLMVFI